MEVLFYEKSRTAFTISEFGKRASTTVRTLIFYEELGLLTPTKQNGSGHKLKLR
ncbi:MerR family DNA-binding transcriptional regulator [Neobacillus endophyticus]|uniref:MerR family DNA-binding transcriptional regulator n=1 Tax=Neobacillus endophyticus TaxID=2738405 RepID=UPI001FE8ABFF|nr:MerR family DNA-binding transcriptional regulator [Neobacillus endophyticus]